MKLLTCEHPKRIYNKYTKEYVWVPCGHCNICNNRRAAHYTQLLERERLQHPITLFFTLTYDDEHLPVIRPDNFAQADADWLNKQGLNNDIAFVGSRSSDNISLTYHDLFPANKVDLYDEADIYYFKDWLNHGGLPYCSKTDVQKFLKRLNKYIHDKISGKYGNFRYFIVSEYGSTTFRSHYHGMLFLFDYRLAQQITDAIPKCWKYGNTDCQPVKGTASSYIAQYINKSAGMPYVYYNCQIRPFFLCSRNPFIGTYTQCVENDAEIVRHSCVTYAGKKKPSDINLTQLPLEFSYQNRLFPKCPLYGSLPDSIKSELYCLVERFKGDTFKEFLYNFFDVLICDTQYNTDLMRWLRGICTFKTQCDIEFRLQKLSPLSVLTDYSINLLRRIYYCCRKVSKQSALYGLTVRQYVDCIMRYYDNKALYKLREFYEFQEELAKNEPNAIPALYPEFLLEQGYSIQDWLDMVDSQVQLIELNDAKYYALSNKKTHYKNAYLDSLKYKQDYYFLYCLIKTYYNAKKCNETFEAIAP